MPIPVMTFQPESFQQSNPFLMGVQSGQDIYSQGVKNAYLPQQMQQQSQAAQLANALAQIQVKYAPQMTQADLAVKQQQVPLMQAQTQRTNLESQYYPKNIESEIALRKAQMGQLDAETQYMPLKYAIDASNSMRSNDRFGQAYQLSTALKNMPAATRDAWIAQHPDDYNQMVNTMADKTLQQQAGAGQSLLNSILPKYFPGTNLQQAAPSSAAQSTAAMNPATLAHSLGGQMPGMQPPNTPNTAPAPHFTSTPEQVDQLRLASEMSANNALTTNFSRKQSESAIKLDNWLKDVQPDYSRSIQNISQYAGLIGKGKKGADALQQENPQAYQDYQWFTNTFRTNIDAMITQMEGTSITPQQQEQYQKMVSDAFDNLTTDPKSSINQINRLMQTLDSISKQRVDVAQPLFKGTAKEAFGYQGIPSPYVNNQPQYSQEDLEFTAKKYGITIDQVKQRLGGK